MSDPAYRVLARKYRPVDFDGLIGQEVLVRTLSNAIAAGRLAQAYVLTGVRGVGKTTSARILARAFNCVGQDGQGGPTVKPCGVCEHCKAIGQDRHVDVLEMDAASNNSVDNIREIVDSARYRPASARYKIYILDEVHMLSNAAFNALLKTLEEPPPHLKFIFATTEIRKVPVTVLSRCQRFDLRRVEAPELAEYLARVAGQEGVQVAAPALALVARAADGSVRDGLSLLDQAITLSDDVVAEAQVRDMLGLADRGVVFDLADALLMGDVPAALAVVGRLHAVGVDPAVILNDLLELTHWLTLLKINPTAADDALMPEAERERAKAMVAPLALPVLARLWQLLLKGFGELGLAPSPRLALEMVLIRTAYAADLPSPADLVKQLQGGPAGGTSGAVPLTVPVSPATSGPRAVGGPPGSPQSVGAMLVPAAEFRPSAKVSIASVPVETAHESSILRSAMESLPAHSKPLEPAPPVAGGNGSLPQYPPPADFAAFVALLEERRIEPLLTTKLRTQVRPVSFAPGWVEVALKPGADSELLGLLRPVLQRLFGGEWQVSRAASSDAPTLAEQRKAEQAAERDAVLTHPLVQATLEAFPGATVGTVRQTVPTASVEGWDAPPLPPSPDDVDLDGKLAGELPDDWNTRWDDSEFTCKDDDTR